MLNRLVCGVLVWVAGTSMAHAQFAVIDVAAIQQLVAQVTTLEQQLATAKDHLAQAQLQFQSLSGARGMERLLSSVDRNYLPGSLDELLSVVQAVPNAYGGLTHEVGAAVVANAVLTDGRLQSVGASEREQIDVSRRVAATLQGVTAQALATTSSRFASLQGLIAALAKTGDPKAVFDLQARISAEGLMLQNEQTKLLSLYELVDAQRRVNEQRGRERVVAGHGMFASRFQARP
ncbi:MAG TPA: type IV secretion system protein [Steroidobacteraceae bacterium]|nr:type IV secretion system protein [Steroidobacteraceae bacterium]